MRNLLFGDDVERALLTLAVLLLAIAFAAGGLVGAGIYHLFGR